MKCIVLGGTGFLGSALIRELLCCGHEVICLVRSGSSLKCLEDVKSQITLWNMDSLSAEAISRENIDVAYNLACRYIGGNTTNLEIVDANYRVPSQFLFDCIDGNVSRFITIGTGLPDDFNLYAITKKQFADLGKYYVAEQERRNQVFSFCNVELERFFGEGEPEERFVPAMINRLFCNEDLLLTAGDQKRDFVYIADVLEVLIKLAEIDVPRYMDIPLGSGQGPTIREVIEYLHQITHSKSKLCFGAVEKRFHEPDSIADLSKLHELGLEIHYDWKQGMQRVVSYMNNE